MAYGMQLSKNKLLFIFCIWAIGTTTGFIELFIYTNKPGSRVGFIRSWPADSGLVPEFGKNLLVVFVHPRCPCSVAVIGELERLMPYIKGRTKSLVVFFSPHGKKPDWSKGALWTQASSIPGVNVVLDREGLEADRFGVKTSGQTFLFDSSSRLVFEGGITPSRGHMGDNDGRDAVIHFVTTGKSPINKTAVFGCSLKNPERALAARKK